MDHYVAIRKPERYKIVMSTGTRCVLCYSLLNIKAKERVLFLKTYQYINVNCYKKREMCNSPPNYTCTQKEFS